MKLWVAICVPDAENARQIAACMVATLRKQAVETGVRVYNSPSALRGNWQESRPGRIWLFSLAAARGSIWDRLCVMPAGTRS